MPGPSNTEVPRVELNQDGTINLVVNVHGPDPGTPVELSGHVSQENGAIATFYLVQEMPDAGPLRVDHLQVVPAAKFDTGIPVTVVARAAQVWVTTLSRDATATATQSRVVVGGEQLQASWNVNDAHWAVAWDGQQDPAVWGAQAGGQPANLLAHGTWPGRLGSGDDVLDGRYTRLFPELPGARASRPELALLASKMTAPPEPAGAGDPDDPEQNPGLPAAYTYLGQFADHDLTFDPISQLRDKLSPAEFRALADYRTPRFDLDNLYGRGPADQPYMYADDGIHLLAGDPMPGHAFDPGAVQLPRGPNGRALIGDPRNDENRILAQLHTLFLRFHNKLADRLAGRPGGSFEEVRRLVRWHYQWVLVNDFLPAIMDTQTYLSVFPDPYRPVTAIPGLRDRDLARMPLEFSVAAYRFGHSMVRPRYRLNADIERPIFAADPGDTADLGGFRPLPDSWAIDWRNFADIDHDAARGSGPQLSYKIDTSLVHPLGDLPARIATGPPPSLAQRNLERGWSFQLPSGQSVARALDLPVLADDELVIGKATGGDPLIPMADIAPGFAGQAPLWAYILAEAQVTSWRRARPGQAGKDVPVRLGPLGGRLVAEVFASLLRGDPTSYLNADRRFVPIREFSYQGRFGLTELINAALDRSP
jgi:hypothetical protein